MSPERRSKLTDLAGALTTVGAGTRLSLGGNVNNNVAMAAVRQLVRSGVGGCHLVAFGQGYGADLLIGAGVVDTVHTNYIGMEHLGLAPCLRRAADEGTVRVVDWDSLGLIAALQAAASGTPFATLPAGVEVTSWPALSPEVYRRTRDPFTGEDVFVVPAMPLDVTVLYVSEADPYGNARHDGFVFWDDLFAHAADRVVVVCERLVDNAAIRADPRRTTLPAHLVDAVVHVPGAARPGGAAPGHAVDFGHLARYCAAARTADGLDAYLAPIRALGEDAYQREHLT